MSEIKKILVTLPFPTEWLSNFSECVALAESAGYSTVVAPGDMDEETLIPWLDDVYGAVCSGDMWTRRVMEKAPHLRVLSRMGVGYDHIDMEAAREKNVLVTITKGANAPDVAEYTFSLMLAAARQIVAADRSVQDGGWPKMFGHSLYGKTLGIVGFGNIGKKLAQLVTGLDMRVLAYDQTADPGYASEHRVSYASLEQIISESDVLSVHLPLTPATRGLIGPREFARMKRNSILINCARGGIVDEAALLKALEDGTLYSAALDVFESEPLPADSPLRGHPRILLSPHIAGLTYEGRGKLVMRAFRNALDVLNGLVPADTVT